MDFQRASRRFNRVIAVSMGFFLLACLALSWAGGFRSIPEPVLWAASIIPVAALLTPVWAQWRFINEIDEFLRSIQLRAIFVGLAVVLVVASAWGFVEMYVDATTVSMYWLNPVYWVTYAIASTYFLRRDGVAL